MNLQKMLQLFQDQRAQAEEAIAWLAPLVGEDGLGTTNGGGPGGRQPQASEKLTRTLGRLIAQRKHQHKRAASSKRHTSTARKQKQLRNETPLTQQVSQLLAKQPMNIETLTAKLLKNGWRTSSKHPSNVVGVTLRTLINKKQAVVDTPGNRSTGLTQTYTAKG